MQTKWSIYVNVCWSTVWLVLPAVCHCARAFPSTPICMYRPLAHSPHYIYMCIYLHLPRQARKYVSFLNKSKWNLSITIKFFTKKRKVFIWRGRGIFGLEKEKLCSPGFCILFSDKFIQILKSICNICFSLFYFCFDIESEECLMKFRAVYTFDWIFRLPFCLFSIFVPCSARGELKTL